MRIEDDCNPLTITEAMTADSATEKFLLICNDNAKLRLINAGTKMCRKVYGLPQTMLSFKVFRNAYIKVLHLLLIIPAAILINNSNN